MWALIMDDNQSYVDSLKEHLKKAGFKSVNRGLEEIDYSTDTAYSVAGKICQAAFNTKNLLIFINIELKLCEGRRQDQMGVDVLKYLRLVESFYPSENSKAVPNRARDAHCVLYSMRTREQLLIHKPENLIITSEGTTFVRLPSDFSELNFDKPIKCKAELNSLAPYFRIDLTLPDDRHDWANWWGIRQLYEVHNRVEKNAKLPYPKKVREELKTLRSRQAIYLYGCNDRDVNKAYSQLAVELKNLRTLLGERNPRILYVDDRWEDGWSTIVRKMIYASASLKAKPITPASASLPYRDFLLRNKPVFRVITSFGTDGTHQQEAKKRLEEICQGIRKALGPGFRPHLILLDLRLFNETGIHYDVASLSGAKVLKWLREQFQSIPVIMTTASNKVWSLEKLLQLGADAFWIKEGLDERRSASETVRNYWRILDLIAKATDERYDFLNRLDVGRLTLFQNRKKKLWWEEHAWNDSQDPGRVTRGRRAAVESILKDTVLMLRSYLQQYELGYGYENQMQERHWAAAILRHSANIIEEVHQLDPADPRRKGTGGLIGGYTENNTFVPRRGDWFGYELYSLRNEAAHHIGAQAMRWEILKMFLANLICYLIHGPQSSFSKVEKWEIKRTIKDEYDYSLGRLEVLRKRSLKNYDTLFRKLLG